MRSIGVKDSSGPALRLNDARSDYAPLMTIDSVTALVEHRANMERRAGPRRHDHLRPARSLGQKHGHHG